MSHLHLLQELLDQPEPPTQHILNILSIHQPFSPTSTTTQPAQINKWLNRINSLLSSNNTQHNSLGATLALVTLHQNQHSILNQRDQWILASQNILSRSNLQSQCFSQVVDLLLCLLDLPSRSTVQSNKKDQSDSKSISSLSKILISNSDQSIEDPAIRSLSIKTLSVLLTRYPSILRPVGSQLESIALSNILNLNEPAIAHSATLILTQLYRLGQKTDQSSNWSKTVKATIGSIQIILDSLLSPFLTEFNPLNSTRIQLSPLEISSQDLIYYSTSNDFTKTTTVSDNNNTTQSSASNRIPILIARIERLVNVLVTILSQSTSRPVNVPLGELTELGSRLILLGKAQVHDRADLDWKSVWELLAGTPTCRAMGCRLLAILAESTRNRFTPFSSQVISILGSEIDGNESQNDQDKQKAQDNQKRKRKNGAVDGSVMYATYARIVSSCPTNPGTIKTSIPPIIRAILQDIQLVYGRSMTSPDSTTNKPGSSKKSNKSKSKKSNDQFNEDLLDWNLHNHSTLVNPLDLQLVERALNSLKILLESIPYFFPSSYLTKSIRILLNLSTNPSFISPIDKSHALNSKLDPATLSSQSIIGSMNNHNNNDTISLNLSFLTRPNIRVSILTCLLKCLPIQKVNSNATGLNLAQTLLEVCTNLTNNNSMNRNDGGLVELARSGTNVIVQLVSRPRVPVIFLTEVQLNAEQDPQSSSESEDEDTEEDQVNKSDHASNLMQDPKNQPPREEEPNPERLHQNETNKINYPNPTTTTTTTAYVDNTGDVLSRLGPLYGWTSNLPSSPESSSPEKRKCSASPIDLPPPKKNNLIQHSLGDHPRVLGKLPDHSGLDSDDDDDLALPVIHFDDDDHGDDDAEHSD